jgi:hypothetical protein
MAYFYGILYRRLRLKGTGSSYNLFSLMVYSSLSSVINLLMIHSNLFGLLIVYSSLFGFVMVYSSLLNVFGFIECLRFYCGFSNLLSLILL